MQTVTSRHNSLLRTVRALISQPDPDGSRLLLDGVHLLKAALGAGLSIELVAVSASRLARTSEEGVMARTLDQQGTAVVSVPDDAFSSLSPVRAPSGLVAIAMRTPVAATTICRTADPFVLGVIDVQDPGNLGALLRVAEAGGANGALIATGSASPFSWKATRGSMGAVLRLPVATGMLPVALLDCTRGNGLRTIAAVPRAGRDPAAIDWTGGVALLVGGEGAGLEDAIVTACDDCVTIPMAPTVESLNVAAAGAILVYAARSQRI